MREQSRYLRSHMRARSALKEVVEMPDLQADRVLRSIHQNGGKLSGVLAKEIPILQRDGIWTEIIDAVSTAFAQDAPDTRVTERFHPGKPVD
ncbi:hypothetical protein IMZ29_03945 [Achromobacter sp. GG226]|uniref:hypothetical protein n=1 Tax=Verticiella alkaliphila TaxID=2779529 RepID=UPI001C0E7169|nr:hypothetical protein [Verticiella sp. GG226]MBU4609730.1 hypothetical protein [Verticiella sp. GG226]